MKKNFRFIFEMNVQTYFNNILDSQDKDRLEDLENFFQRLEHVESEKASFIEIK